MEKIRIKVLQWDGESLIISAINPDEQEDHEAGQSLAFQPYFYNETDLDEILKIIAKSCVSNVQANLKKNKFAKDIEWQKKISFCVGNTYEWNVNDLYQRDIEESESISSDDYSSLTVEEKLELAGITIEELKKALGID
jgi:hypothetical protein